MELDKDFKEFIKLLNEHKVSYLVIGGYAVNSIREWWYSMGHECYQKTNRLPITADSGGSNSSRSRLWKVELQKLTNELKMIIEVSHLPRAPANGVKLSIRCFASFLEIGGASHSLRNGP